jgi:DNA polymerase-3 subunit epsilon
MASTKYPKIEDLCDIEDSLQIARDKYPGQRNSLDALAQRFDVKGYDRTFHGALLDANILSDVFIQLTGGQSKFEFITNGNTYKEDKIDHNDFDENLLQGLKPINASQNDIKSHESRLSDIEKKYEIKTIWRKL